MKDDIDRAIAAGIPVITVDSDAPSSKRLFFIGTDNYHAGQIGGQRLAKEINGKGNVVVFTIPEQANLKERLRGYRDALEATPGIKITRVVDMKGDSRVAFDTATEILGNDKKEHVDAFVCLEALSGKEVATVLSQHEVKDKIIIAMDTDDKTLEWIQKGVIAATISQKPYTMSFVGLKMLDDLYHHKLSTLTNDWAKDSFAPIPAFVDTGSALVDKTNVDALIAASKSVTSNTK
jgi:ribose transport system substrate-binding protein